MIVDRACPSSPGCIYSRLTYYPPGMPPQSGCDGTGPLPRRFPRIVDPGQQGSGLLSPSLRFELRRVLDKLRSQMSLAKLWRWEFVRLREDHEGPFEVTYIGRREGLGQACGILGLVDGPAPGRAPAAMRSPHGILVSEFPLPGALRVPRYVDMVVRLGRPLEDIVEHYSKSLRRRLRKELGHVELRPVTDDEEIRAHLSRDAGALRAIATRRSRPQLSDRVRSKDGAGAGTA